MLGWIRSLSQRAEFLIVFTVGFGNFLLGNLFAVLAPMAEPAISDASLLQLVIFEVIVLLPLVGFLYVRGWRLRRVGSPFVLADLGVGAVLALGGTLIATVAATAAVAIWPALADSFASPDFVAGDIQPLTLGLTSTVNPVFEELLLCGYLVTVLKERRGLWTAVNVSLAVRTFCHLYQGVAGVVSIIPFGFVATYWYARTGRLWPVIIAHAILDAVGLWPFLA